MLTRRYRGVCLLMCALTIWLSCQPAFARPIKPESNIAVRGCKALDDLLQQKPRLKPDREILRDYALAVEAKDDKGPLGMTLIPLEYPGDPAVGAKAIRIGYLVATDESQKRQRGDQVLELGYSQPSKGKYQLLVTNLTTGKKVPPKTVSQVVKSTVWFERLDRTQQGDPENGHSALYVPEDNPDCLALALKTRSERTWFVPILVGAAVGGFFVGYAFGTIYFRYRYWF